MTLPASGAITLSDVNVELELSPTAAISLNDAAVRALAGKPTGAISLADLHGKSYHTYAVWGNVWGVSKSNGDLTVSGTGNAVANTFKNSGKWYWEHVITEGASISSVRIGVATSAFNYSSYWLSGDAGGDSMCWYSTDVWWKAATVGSLDSYVVDAFAVNDVLGIAWDADNRHLQFYRNNVPKGTYPCDANVAPAISLTAAGSYSLTANFGATALAYTPPAGFNSGLYT